MKSPSGLITGGRKPRVSLARGFRIPGRRINAKEASTLRWRLRRPRQSRQGLVAAGTGHVPEVPRPGAPAVRSARAKRRARSGDADVCGLRSGVPVRLHAGNAGASQDLRGEVPARACWAERRADLGSAHRESDEGASVPGLLAADGRVRQEQVRGVQGSCGSREVDRPERKATGSAPSADLRELPKPNRPSPPEVLQRVRGAAEGARRGAVCAVRSAARLGSRSYVLRRLSVRAPQAG